jgi:hypothetical protein
MAAPTRQRAQRRTKTAKAHALPGGRCCPHHYLQHHDKGYEKGIAGDLCRVSDCECAGWIPTSHDDDRRNDRRKTERAAHRGREKRQGIKVPTWRQKMQSDIAEVQHTRRHG